MPTIACSIYNSPINDIEKPAPSSRIQQKTVAIQILQLYNNNTTTLFISVFII